MENTFVVRKKINLKATPEQVWDALTKPELTKQFFYKCEVFSDWKPGSAISFKRKFLWMNFELKGKILEIVPGKLLRYTLTNSKSGGNDPANFSTVTDELTYQDGLTTLSITDDVGAAKGAEKRYKRSLKGWDKILEGLKGLVER
jgi:uncharacterized protein YndB with AHSA1/START domain